MPARHQRSGNDAVVLAETIQDRLSGLPYGWKLTAFLERTRTETTKVHTFKDSDQECDRIRNRGKWVEVGTYTASIGKVDLTTDVREAMARL